MPPQLSPAERRSLKARAHALEPAVLIGRGGMTPAVQAELESSLSVHELIKVRVPGDNRAAREEIMQQICNHLSAAAVQHIGRILVVYRAKPDAAPESNMTKTKTKKTKRKAPRALKRSFQNLA